MIFTQIKGYEMGTFNDPNFWTSGGGGHWNRKVLIFGNQKSGEQWAPKSSSHEAKNI